MTTTSTRFAAAVLRDQAIVADRTDRTTARLYGLPLTDTGDRLREVAEWLDSLAPERLMAHQSLDIAIDACSRPSL